MPIYMNIDRLEHIVMMVAHGTISDEDIREITRDLIDADVAAFGKIIDTTAAVSSLTKEQVAAVAEMLRSAPDNEKRGPVAYVVNPDRIGFAHSFAEESKGDRPINLFTSLREARQWVSRVMAERDAAKRP